MVHQLQVPYLRNLSDSFSENALLEHQIMNNQGKDFLMVNESDIVLVRILINSTSKCTSGHVEEERMMVESEMENAGSFRFNEDVVTMSALDAQMRRSF
ncbi:hypothetical protein FNV43_RR01203 [Rhamnella rubrinervis]|uniref:Uncharacterized protein n=1 Tax=Rhamnella rubrinervis TaxID=2594499 RepID=A0A8K0HQ21_9ROSA|nr:hypothetical protein FNV43_RR01203 [Rhamnella rubrinervis]